tara:strand:- start:2070 stop:2732 length:663 start_codon:yes stop_codon:yes gene_type:complete
MKMTQYQVKRIYEILSNSISNPTTELKYSNSFELLIAVILSAQSTDIAVNKVTKSLFSAAKTPGEMHKLGLQKLKTLIKTIGLYNTKAKNILHTCHILEQQYANCVPKDRDALEALPGVGRKTANVVLNTAFGELTIGVDTHIFRVSNRTGLANGKNVYEVEKTLLKVTPRKYIKDAHHLLLLHGRYVCTAKKPHCTDCKINRYCDYYKNFNAEHKMNKF